MVGLAATVAFAERAAGSERWIKPILVAEVSFAEWTPDGSVRHAKFEGLRDDKAAKTIRREVPGNSAAPVAKKAVGRNIKVSTRTVSSMPARA